MPRNSSGTYSLPAGNPVVTGTTISTVWANTTLSDIGTAMTDSLSRSGDGGMLAPLELVAGAIGAPALTWGAETTSGLYRAGAGDFRFAIAGVDVWSVGSSGSYSLRILAGDGTVAAPGIAFNSDQDTGFYRIGANELRMAVGGAAMAIFSSAVAQFNATQTLVGDGLVGTPGISFSNDPDTGIYRIGANELRIAVGGAAMVVLNSSVAQFNSSQVLVNDGLVGTPGLSFFNDPDTGMYRPGADTIRFATGGVLRLDMSSGGFKPTTVILPTVDGAVGAPLYSFDNDPDTGIYRPGADEIRIATGGVLRLALSSGGLKSAVVNLPLIDGTAGAPVYSFDNDSNTGVFRAGADDMSFSAGGTTRMSVNGTSVIVNTVPFHVQDGSVGAASVSFFNDPDTGLYRLNANELRITTGGSAMMIVSSAATQTNSTQFLTGDGAVGTPSHSFANDPDTGFFRDTANQIAIALAGAAAGQIAQGSFTMTLTGFTAAPTPSATWQRIGNLVIIRVPQFASTSNGVGFTCTNIPAIIQPSTPTYAWIGSGQDNSVQSNTVSCLINGATMTFQIGNGALWTNANNKGLGIVGFAPSVTIVYEM